MPRGNDDGVTYLTGGLPLRITAIDDALSRVTFNGAHNLDPAKLGDIIPGQYDNASELHQRLAFLADATNTLGTANDPGQQFN